METLGAIFGGIGDALMMPFRLIGSVFSSALYFGGGALLLFGAEHLLGDFINPMIKDMMKNNGWMEMHDAYEKYTRSNVIDKAKMLGKWGLGIGAIWGLLSGGYNEVSDSLGNMPQKTDPETGEKTTDYDNPEAMRNVIGTSLGVVLMAGAALLATGVAKDQGWLPKPSGDSDRDAPSRS
ncbi:MAG: hypothetical protein MRY32_00345 [Rickettsiales bacterium]|nr:hypothetical protein [Rickettsiales bacterium]